MGVAEAGVGAGLCVPRFGLPLIDGHSRTFIVGDLLGDDGAADGRCVHIWASKICSDITEKIRKMAVVEVVDQVYSEGLL